MTTVEEYSGNFLTTKDNKLQTLHFTKCLKYHLSLDFSETVLQQLNNHKK